MLRTGICLAAMLLAAGLHAASAQTATAPATPAPAATTDAKPPGKIKLTMQKLKDMKAKWSANKPKLKACRADVKSKGLIGDDRWFYIEECMSKS
jgi:phosphate-selective porin